MSTTNKKLERVAGALVMGQVIDIGLGQGAGLPDAAWVKDLGLTNAEISDWLAESVTTPEWVGAVYAGLADNNDWYIVLTNTECATDEELARLREEAKWHF